MIRSASPVNSPDISAMPGRVVRDRAEAVFGHDHAGRGQQPDTGEGHQVEGELDVAVAQPDGHADGDGDGDDRPHRRLEADGDTGEHRRRRAGRADAAISFTGLLSVEVKYSVIWLATSERTTPVSTA